MIEYIRNIRKYIGHERLLVAGASIIIHKDGRLLMQKRKDNGCWSPEHGGCVEIGETVEETARRELFEETGLTANSLELLGVFSGKDLLYTYPNGDMVSIVGTVFLCEDFSGEMKINTDETSDLQWFEFEKLPDNISPPVIPVLACCVDLLRKRENDNQPNSFSIEFVETYREFVNEQIIGSWSGPFVASKGILHDTRTHKGFTAVNEEGEVVGYILYTIVDSDCEITVLESLCKSQGIGSALINAVKKVAKEAGCTRIWLITTNDNTNAIRFYQRFGFLLCAVHIDAMDEARTLKPQIPLLGDDDIPIAHEFEFEMRV